MLRTVSDPTRAGAFELLVAVSERRRALDEALDALPAMESRDRAAAHRLAAAVLRRESSLDAVLAPHLKRAPPPRVRLVLRLGAAGLLLLDTPPHAAVGTAVDLVRALGLAAFAGLVNAVLRRVAEAGPAALAALDAPLLDTPPWLWASWGERARAIATAHAGEAAIDLTMRPGAEPPLEGAALPGGSVRVPAGTRIAGLAGYEEGAFFVQDVAATLPARLLGDVAGQRVCDLCAAPGGKTAQLALAGARVTAVDRDARRLRRLHENCARLRLAVDVVEGEVIAWSGEAGPRFDAVLLDAPCSATGTIRRHPDVLRLRRPADLIAVAAVQADMIRAAAGLLPPGGRLVYAACSLQPEEGERQLAMALASGLWRHAPVDAAAELEPEFAPCIDAHGHLRTDPALWPERGGMDGFFAMRLVRV